MASGAKMSFNFYQNGKHGTLPQNPSGKDVEVSQDMHIKMSKKIAQLTKVIYALNTKNDEHETIVQSIREQHEEQMQALLAETKHKIEFYKNKMSGVSSQGNEIELLQKCLNEQQTEKQRALFEFQEYKRKTEESQLQLKTEHSKRVLELTEQVAKAKREFEEQLRNLDLLKEQFEREKRSTIDELTERHRAELERILQSQEGTESDLLSAKETLEQQHQQQLSNFKSQLDALNNEKTRLVSEYESKLDKAQAFYERELDALRKSQNASAEEQIQTLTAQLDRMKKDYAFSEKQLQDRVNELINKLSISEEDTERVRGELERLQNSLKDKDSNSQALLKQLEAARQEARDALTKQKQAETDLIGARITCEQQAKDLVAKSGEIGHLQATQLQNESTIRELEAQLAKLRDRLAVLESAKRALESQNQEMNKEQSSQVLSLQQIARKQHDLKKKLKVTFMGEAGLDMGGLTKEWFLLLLRKIFLQEYGMFTYDTTARVFWFRSSPSETYQEFNLVGVLMGLAVYNSIILDIHFPPVCYRKLLSPAVVPYSNPGATVGVCTVTLRDLHATKPELARGLQELLDYEGDVQEDFGLTFQISYEEFGSVKTHYLKENGENIPVTNSNKKEYVDLYVDYLLNRAVYRQFQAFYHGFHSVCASNALIILRPEEVEMLVCGSPNLNMSELRKVTVYDGYTSSDNTIRMFWDVVLALSTKIQKRFLLFATGSDRVPIGGMSEMQFKITKVNNIEMLPMAHTCFNQLVLPAYVSKKQLRQKLLIAIQNAEGFGIE